MPVARSLTL